MFSKKFTHNNPELLLLSIHSHLRRNAKKIYDFDLKYQDFKRIFILSITFSTYYFQQHIFTVYYSHIFDNSFELAKG